MSSAESGAGGSSSSSAEAGNGDKPKPKPPPPKLKSVKWKPKPEPENKNKMKWGGDGSPDGGEKKSLVYERRPTRFDEMLEQHRYDVWMSYAYIRPEIPSRYS